MLEQRSRVVTVRQFYILPNQLSKVATHHVKDFDDSKISQLTQKALSSQIYKHIFIFLSTYVNLIEAGSFTILADIANIVFPKVNNDKDYLGC